MNSLIILMKTILKNGWESRIRISDYYTTKGFEENAEITKQTLRNPRNIMLYGGYNELYAVGEGDDVYVTLTDEDIEYLKSVVIKYLQEKGFNSIEDYIGGAENE